MKNKIAFLCLAHNNFTFLEHLSKYYCSDGDGFFLHIDANANEESLTNISSDTVILPHDERYRTRWGTMNIVLASLTLLKRALLEEKYERFILISGSDTPLVSKKILKEQLAQDYSYFSIWQEVQKNIPSLAHNEFFNRHYYHCSLTNPGEAYLTKSRIRIYLMLILNKAITLLPSTKQFSYSTYVKGSQWWTVTRELATHMVGAIENKENYKQFQEMHAPDEKLFHTIAFNSPFIQKIIVDKGQDNLKHGLHYIDWGIKSKTNKLQGFAPEDVEKAKKLGCYFARKVENENLDYFIDFIKQLNHS